jgi:hypothetical protein
MLDSEKVRKFLPKLIHQIGPKFVELSNELDVTLASQSSFDRLHWLIYVAKLW